MMVHKSLRALYYWELKINPQRDWNAISQMIERMKKSLDSKQDNSYWSPSLKKIGPVVSMRQSLLEDVYIHGPYFYEAIILPNDGQ